MVGVTQMNDSSFLSHILDTDQQRFGGIEAVAADVY